MPQGIMVLWVVSRLLGMAWPSAVIVSVWVLEDYLINYLSGRMVRLRSPRAAAHTERSRSVKIMNLIIFYTAVIIMGLATGNLQYQALSKNKPTLLIATLLLRLTLLVLAGCAVPLLHLSLLHFILSIILFWGCSLWYVII